MSDVIVSAEAVEEVRPVDGWREYDDAVPIVATTLELLATRGPLGPVWWRYGRDGRHSLIEALENPNNRAAYDLRQAAREKKAQQDHRELGRWRGRGRVAAFEARR
ncbi:hypothetical protein ACWCXH_31915 [Kitasatospora sp. NPDC001660]